MEWIDADSEAIARFAYSGARRIVTIELTVGTVYKYFDVPEFAFIGLMHAPSKGRYFAEQIRDVYDFEPVDG